MISATNLKNSTCFLYEGKPLQVIKYTHIKMGRGGATVRVSARNLSNGKMEEKTFPSTAKFEEVSTSKKELTYLYRDGDRAVFADPTDYSQSEIDIDLIKGQLQYIKEGQNVDVLFRDDEPVSIELAPKVALEVVETDPGVKGNSSTNVYKPAKCENGIQVRVPLFIKTGDTVNVDTRTGEYLERASQKSTRERSRS